jgi:thiamine-monophosphate kinase
MAHITLGPGSEFDLVRALLARWGTIAEGTGDDAAIVDVPAGEKLVVSTDTSVEFVHFKREWLTAQEIGYRAAAAALSDLAAMGATPLGMTVAMTLPDAWRPQALELADGMAELARATGMRIIGGDLTSGATLTITVTVLGSARSEQLLRRDGAVVGQVVYVTGRFGGPGAAVRALSRDETPAPGHRERFAHPVPRIREAIWLAAEGATAAVDCSDGLVADAAHIAAASGRRLVLDLNQLPLVDGVTELEGASSGEEYELVITGPESLDTDRFAREFGVPLTAVGRVEIAPATGPDVIVLYDGRVITPPTGHDHFRP